MLGMEFKTIIEGSMAGIDLIPSETRRTLLQLMKRRGEISLDDAMEATDLARTTLREHLNQLERDGLVHRRTEKQGRGRPRLRYRLSDGAEPLFPHRDGLLLRHLLRYLKDRGEESLIEGFFESFWAARTREVEHRLRQVGAEGDMARKLEVLEEVLREEGFMPEIERDGERLVVRECNCPFSEAVKQTRLPCRLEAAFYEAVFDAQIERVSYIPEGRSACSYEFPEMAGGER